MHHSPVACANINKQSKQTSMFIHAVERALNENRHFVADSQTFCSSLEVLLEYLPSLLSLVDSTLFDGELEAFLKREKISLQLKQSTKGPAGVTTYDTINGMKISLNANAWLKAGSSGMVGGNLCQRADRCLIQTFLHEMVHVTLFCIYIELDLTQKEAEEMIPTDFDPTHNIIFTTWLKKFFNQDTIDNSLLLRPADANHTLQFKQGINEIERVCLAQYSNMMVFYQGVWQAATVSKNQTNVQPHHSRIMTVKGQKLIVPNGLLSC